MRKIFILILLLIFLLTPVPVFAQSSNLRLQIGKDITVNSNEDFAGDVIAILGNVTVDGRVSGDVIAILGNVKINGEVMGNVTAIGGSIIRGEVSKVYGSSTEIGTFRGLIDGIKRYNLPLEPGLFYRNIRYSLFKVMSFLGRLAFGILVILLFPNAINRASNMVEREIGKKILLGLAILLLLPAAVLLMLITLIGIPLIPIFLILVYAAVFFGYLCICIFIGRKLSERMIRKPELLLDFVLGALILWLLQWVPFIGSLISLAVLIISIGIAAETQFGMKAD